MKRLTGILFLFTALTAVLTLSAIPHHHHGDNICMMCDDDDNCGHEQEPSECPRANMARFAAVFPDISSFSPAPAVCEPPAEILTPVINCITIICCRDGLSPICGNCSTSSLRAPPAC